MQGGLGNDDGDERRVTGRNEALQVCKDALVGLVDVKVCAIDETWLGLKLVIRKSERSPKIS